MDFDIETYRRSPHEQSAFDIYMASLLSEAQYADIAATWTLAFDPTSRPNLRLRDEP